MVAAISICCRQDGLRSDITVMGEIEKTAAISIFPDKRDYLRWQPDPPATGRLSVGRHIAGEQFVQRHGTKRRDRQGRLTVDAVGQTVQRPAV